MNVYRYGFRYRSGEFVEMTEQQCLGLIQEKTGLDATMARVCLGRDGVKTPAGEFVRVTAWRDVG